MSDGSLLVCLVGWRLGYVDLSFFSFASVYGFSRSGQFVWVD